MSSVREVSNIIPEPVKVQHSRIIRNEPDQYVSQLVVSFGDYITEQFFSKLSQYIHFVYSSSENVIKLTAVLKFNTELDKYISEDKMIYKDFPCFRSGKSQLTIASFYISTIWNKLVDYFRQQKHQYHDYYVYIIHDNGEELRIFNSFAPSWL